MSFAPLHHPPSAATLAGCGNRHLAQIANLGCAYPSYTTLRLQLTLALALALGSGSAVAPTQTTRW